MAVPKFWSQKKCLVEWGNQRVAEGRLTGNWCLTPILLILFKKPFRARNQSHTSSDKSFAMWLTRQRNNSRWLRRLPSPAAAPQNRLPRHFLSICLAALFFLCVHTSDPAFAKPLTWYRYDNSHFVAYSNAREEKARELLDDLERFRAAFLQVGNIVIPETAPKTRVVIVGSKNFSRYAPVDLIDGFAITTDNGSILVLKAWGYKDWAKAVIRHEYGHALLGYKEIRYPWWYEEGFAELVSSLKFNEDGRSFVFGGVTDRARYGARPNVDWDALVAGTVFFEHDFTPASASNAYLQAWILAHYTTLGDRLANSVKLQRYFDGIRAGEQSSDAFQGAFGMSANDLWASELEVYAQRMPAYTVQFDPGALDLEFRHAPAEDADYRPLLEYLHERHVAQSPENPPRKPLQYLPGRWAELRPGNECIEPRNFQVDTDAGTVMIDPFAYVADEAPTPRTFTYDLRKKRTIWLSPVDGIRPGEAAGPWLVKLRGKNMLCLSQPDSGAPACETIMKRCSP